MSEVTLTREEVAHIVKHSVDWVTQNMLITGRLPACRLGRRWIILRSDLDKWLKDQTGKK